MDSIRKVVLLGATGTVGSHILSVLIAPDSPFTVTILTRPDSTADFSTILQINSSVTIIRKSYTLTDLTTAFHGHDAVISATSVSSIAIQTTILDAARAAGISRFILNEFANSPIHQTGLPELMPYREVKDQVREYADQLARNSLNTTNTEATTISPFTWTALATGNLIDLSLSRYPIFGFTIPTRTARLVDDGLEPFTATTLHDIGLAVRGILLHPAETANRYVHIRSVCTSQRGILDALETATNQKWTVDYVSSEMLLERGRKLFAVAETQRQGMLDLLIVQLFERGAGRSVVVPLEECDNELVGVQEKDVSVIVKDVLQAMGAI